MLSHDKVTGEKGTDLNPDAVSKSMFSYDNLSRVTEESQAIKEDTAVVVEYTYDQAGNRLTLQQDAAETTVAYAYDTRDRCVDIDQYDVADSEWVLSLPKTPFGPISGAHGGPPRARISGQNSGAVLSRHRRRTATTETESHLRGNFPHAARVYR